MAKKLGGGRRDSRRNKVARKIRPLFKKPLQTAEILSNQQVANQRRVRGRPSAISDTELACRRQEIQSKLEEYWGEVAWACMHSRTPEDIRKAFAIFRLSGTTSGRLVECLTRASFEKVTAAGVAASRQKYWQARQIAQECGERYNQIAKKVEQLERAKNELLNPPRSNPPSAREATKNLRYINDEITKHLNEAERLKSELDQARTEEDSLYEELQIRESAFARNEVLNFLRSKRYALTPRKFALAIAGLPFMGWRQSMKRTTKLAEGSEDWPTRPAYEYFLAFQYMFKGRRLQTREGVVKLLNKEIPRLPRIHHNAKADMIENRPWLREALTKLKREPLLTKKLPFVLSSAFWKAVDRPKTEMDIVMASSVTKEGQFTLS